MALPTSSALSAARNLDSLRVRSDITLSERMHAVFSTALSIVNTEAKNLLNRSAIPAGVSVTFVTGQRKSLGRLPWRHGLGWDEI